MLEWLKRHAWKVCKRQKRFAGSNPALSAVYSMSDQVSETLFVALFFLYPHNWEKPWATEGALQLSACAHPQATKMASSLLG